MGDTGLHLCTCVCACVQTSVSEGCELLSLFCFRHLEALRRSKQTLGGVEGWYAGGWGCSGAWRR